MTAATASGEPKQLPLLGLAEVALAAVTAGAVFGLHRLFAGGGWFEPLLLQVVAAHAFAAVLRRFRVPLFAALPGLIVVGVIAAGVIYAQETMYFGVVPSGDMLPALNAHLGDAWAAFSDVRAPTEALDGFLIAASGAVWLLAGLSDWAAFRIDAPFEAVLPSGTLFVLASILGGDDHRVLSTAVWIGPILAFLLFRRADRITATSAWVGEHRSRGPRTMLLIGGGLAIASLVVAAIVAPQLPGADSDAIVSIQELGDDGPGTRVTVSPLVDIRTRLVDQANVEVFTVESSERAYWRLTSLDRFDGRIWSSNGSFGKEKGNLPAGVDVEAARVTFDQNFRIKALAQIWLPAAYEPAAIAAATDVRYDETSGTLIIDTDTPSSDGLEYSVRSALPTFDPAALAAATTEIPQDVAERYLGLPANFSPAVAQTAIEVTGSASSRYEQMLLLQNFFRDNFTYDLDVGPGHDGDVLEDFVTRSRVGYCEQFAGSFAAMARSLGVPARVSVGFTPGNTSPTNPNVFSVRGENAHAWPEVYLGEFGWVAFEPTPGRGAPFAESYTGVPEQQAALGQPTVATTVPDVPASIAPPNSAPVTAPNSVTLPDFGGEGEIATAGDTSSGPGWFARFFALLVVLAGLAAVYFVTVPLLGALLRQRRRSQATEIEAKVGLAWDESILAARDAGLTVPASATHRQAAETVAAGIPQATEPIRSLATTVETITFAGAPASSSTASTAFDLADAIRAAALASRPTKQRYLDQYDPRRIMARRRRQRRDRSGPTERVTRSRRS